MGTWRLGSFGLLLTMLTAVGCERSAVEPRAEGGGEPGPLRVHVVNEPLHTFAERIGGDAALVSFPVPADVDPAHWSPDADTVAAFQSADLILLNGAGYTRWVATASLRRAALVDTSSAYHDLLIERSAAPNHRHGPEGPHAHGELAFTTWLDPTLAILQARSVEAAFAGARPEQAAEFAERADALERDLEAIDVRLGVAASRLGDAPLLFSHPVYAYLERRYALNGRSVEWEPDAPPDERSWRALEDLLADHPAQWMLWEAEPLAATAERLAELGVQSVVFAPCGNRPAEGDFLSVMLANATRLQEVALRPVTPR